MRWYQKGALLLTALLGSAGVWAQEVQTVAITQIVEHPSLDAMHQGIVDGLADEGYAAGKNIRYIYEIAQGNMAVAAQIAKKFAGERPAVAVGIATPSSQSLAAAVRDVPVVFTAVTDPVGARLVKDLQHPGKNITGIANPIDLEQAVALIHEIVPNVRRIGTIYNPGEVNSAGIIERLKALLQKQGTELVIAPANSSGEVLGAARSLVGKVDVIFYSLDHTVASALESLLQVAEQNHIPVFATDTDSVERGVVAALGFDYYQIGRQSARQIAAILRGKKPSEIPIAFPEKNNLYINLDAAQKMGATIPQAVLDRADKVIR